MPRRNRRRRNGRHARDVCDDERRAPARRLPGRPDRRTRDAAGAALCRRTRSVGACRWHRSHPGNDRPAPRCPPDAVADARPDRSGAGLDLLCRGADRFRQAGRRSRRDARRNPDPAGQGARDRHRLRSRQPRHPGSWRHGLHRGNRRRAALSRRAHRADLRGHQRHPGRGPRRAQAWHGGAATLSAA